MVREGIPGVEWKGCITQRGLSIYASKLKSHDGEMNAMIGGSHESFKFFSAVAGGVMNLIQSFLAGLQSFRDGAMPRILGNPITFEEIECAKKSNLKFGEVNGLEELLGDNGLFEEYGVADARDVVMECDCCGEETTLATEVPSHDGEERGEFSSLPSRVLVNSEERSLDFRRWKELMDTGINIEYRCIRCRVCNDCRNADQTEKVSLRQDAEDDMIKNSVTLDYSKQEILAMLPLRG